MKHLYDSITAVGHWEQIPIERFHSVYNDKLVPKLMYVLGLMSPDATETTAIRATIASLFLWRHQGPSLKFAMLDVREVHGSSGGKYF
jgi:hypothetical protein